jgi:DUF2934 family protein
MIAKANRRDSRASKNLKIVAVPANEQTRRVKQAVARRAYEIFERRGSTPRHELEDWREAEAELVRPCCSGRMSVNGTLWMGTDAAVFEKDTIEIWVAPRQLTVCGKPRATKESSAAPAERGRPYPEKVVFHVIDVDCEIDPSRVTAKTNGSSLEIFLTKANAEPEVKAEATAAVA